jgi:Omp85 superfamily domain
MRPLARTARSRLAALAIAIGLAAAASPAAADPAASPRRAVPEYDGRPSETTAGDALLWIPRVVVSPLYFVSEYVLREPIGAATASIERGGAGGSAGASIGVVPTGLVDFGRRTTAGLYVFADGFPAHGHELRLHAVTGGSDVLSLAVADRVALDPGSWVKLRAEASTRADQPFYGVGSRSLESSRSRYAADVAEGSVTFHLKLGPGAALEAWAGVKGARFEAIRGSGTAPPLLARVYEGQLALPSGFDGGYIAARQGLGLSIDSRRPRPAPQSGIRLAADVEHDADLRDPGRSRWIAYGASALGSLDLTGHARVLSLGIATRFADPLGDAEVPFAELATLGGDAPMRGFLAGRLLGRSAAAATLEYRYPIWAFFDGTLTASAGNVFGPHLQDFDPRLLRLSFDAGVRMVGDRDHALTFLVGFGTETFRDGTKPNAVRFLLGGTKGF